MSGRAAPSGPPARLLLADSDPALRRVLHLALEAHGYQVALADTAAVALELAGHQHPDLIVLDGGLPGAAAAIQALRRASATPILLLTWPTDSHRQAALDIAAADALTKPFGIDELLQRLRALRGPAHSPSRQGQKDTTGGGAPWAPS
jgi:two-component system, OmpR family, KDP operon response regulator KdpE